MRLSTQSDCTTAGHAVFCKAMIVCTLLVFSTIACADELERRQAKRLHDRLTGIPPEESVLDDMEADFDGRQ